MFKPHIICWIFFCSHSQKKNKILWGVLILLSLFLCWFSSIGNTEYNYVYVFNNPFLRLLHYLSITSNLLFVLLNITNASKQHTRFLSRSFSRQVPGLSNRCTFALANGLDGRFISRYWVNLIGFSLCPPRDIVWHLSTKVNNSLLVVYITVLAQVRVSVGSSK